MNLTRGSKLIAHSFTTVQGTVLIIQKYFSTLY
jgi:hypothetical protein